MRIMPATIIYDSTPMAAYRADSDMMYKRGVCVLC